MSQKDDRTICATKFRAMLTCVERTGTTACTEKINAFLSCERAVLHKALSTPPSNDHRIPARPIHTPTPKQNFNHSPKQEDLPNPGTMFSRVVEKQIAACTSLTDSVRRPQFMTGLWSFSRRMVADIRVTLSAVGVKVGKVVDEIRDRFGED